MKKMKDSGIEWIGQIPQEWDTIKLSYLFDTIGSGTTPATSNGGFYDGEYAWLQTGDLTDGIITETSKTITQEAVDSHSTLALYKKGSIVIAMYGATIGKLGILGIDCYTNQACCAMADPINIDAKFVYYWLMCNKDNIVRLSLGGGQPNISQSIISSLRVALPKNIDEQFKISNYLDAKCTEIDALITSKEKTNELLKERRQSIIYEAVTKGLNPDAPMKDSGIEWIGMIPEHWSVGKLGYFIDVFNGDRSSNYPSGSDIQESGVPFLTSSNLEYDILDMSDSKYISEEKYASMSGLKMELDDIIYCLRGSVGKCSINKTEICGTVASSLMGIRCKKMVPDYLLFVLKSAVIETQNALFMNGTCAANLSAENVCGYLLPIPSETEQREIATHLQGRCVEMDNLISASEATIQKLKEYRQSIIYEAVTGKIEI